MEMLMLAVSRRCRSSYCQKGVSSCHPNRTLRGARSRASVRLLGRLPTIYRWSSCADSSCATTDPGLMNRGSLTQLARALVASGAFPGLLGCAQIADADDYAI